VRTTENPHGHVPLAYLLLTAVVCGAMVMVLEILGSRVIGPFFGVSLFVWTSLITVTLISLAGGYAAGGALSDRGRAPERLYAIIVAAGVLVLAVPLLKGAVLKACLGLGLRTGALTSALLLFGPALFLLGSVSPFLLRVAVREMHSLGRTVGLFSALSTIGSFFGTVLTGFVLIAHFGVDRIFQVVGGLLIALGAGYFLLVGRRWRALPLLALPVLLPLPGAAGTHRLPSGVEVTRVAARSGFYGLVRVLDYRAGDNHTREMTIDGLIQGGIDVASGMSVYAYSYLLELIPRAVNPSGRTCLVIGLGGGTIPMAYERQGVRTDVVDIDPNVVEAARSWFGFRNTGRMILADARSFLLSSRDRYDYIILDVFTGDTTPAHLLSVEAMRLVRERLAADGVFGINLVGALRGDTFITASLVRTLRQVFDAVEIHPLFDPAVGDGFGNMVIIAHDGPALQLPPGLATARQVHPLAWPELARYFGTTFRFPAGTEAIVLTDDYNPVDFYDLGIKEKVRRAIIAQTPLDLLL
jgi:spermidine synthase